MNGMASCYPRIRDFSTYTSASRNWHDFDDSYFHLMETIDNGGAGSGYCQDFMNDYEPV
jgi:hypothetical protein